MKAALDHVALFRRYLRDQAGGFGMNREGLQWLDPAVGRQAAD